jgi:23S rRNA (cytidine1920-2'-O)/16S rRNA (cytidine1409-2'-O)-methyltransferase
MKAKHPRKRLDAVVVERGLAESLPKARAMILAGEIWVDGARAEKAGAAVSENARIEVLSRAQKYASRGGIKLAGALEDFAIYPAGCVCLDVGASTGGFTDCLLQNGAARVYAVDVSIDQLAWKLQQDSRVARIERNARELRREDISEPIDLAAVDVSFISVAKLLTPVLSTLKPGGQMLVLVKPQFELPREDVGAGGIVADVTLHERAIAIVREAATAAGLEIVGLKPSRLTGAEGNQEYFLHARKKRLE